MNQELEKLIDYAVSDGVISESERTVLYKKAHELNVDISEFEMILGAKLYQKQQELSNFKTKSNVEKLGKVKKCPNCGEVVNPLDIKCQACGFELNITTSNQTLNDFLNKLVELGETKKSNISQKTDIISHFPIPNNKEDLFEFLSICIPQIEQNTSSLNGYEKKILTAWLIKSRQLLIKANSLFKDDKEFIKKITILDQQVDKKLKQIKTRGLILNSIKILLFISILIAGYVYWTENLYKKSEWEIFSKSVQKKYGDAFNEYKETPEYKRFLERFEKYYASSHYGYEKEWEILRNEKIGISDLMFYMKAIKYRIERNDEIAGRYLDTAIALNPDFAYAYYLKAKTLSFTMADSAFQLHSKAIYLKPDVWRFYDQRASVSEDKYDKLKDLMAAEKLNPNDVFLQFSKVTALHDTEGPFGRDWCKDFEELKRHKDYKKILIDFESIIKALNKKCLNGK
jgi:hypothetical protein